MLIEKKSLSISKREKLFSKKNIRYSNCRKLISQEKNVSHHDDWPEWKQRAALANYKFGE